jgi:hypothetical protein
VIQALEARRARRQPPARRPASGAPAPPALTQTTPDALTHREQAGSERRDAANDARPERTTPALSNPNLTFAPPAEAASVSPDSAADARRSPAAHTASEASLVSVGRDEPIANYAVRVRRSLDDLAAWRLAELRRHGVRTSKVELTEMLLWELAHADLEELNQRVAAFRSHAPR